MKLVTQLIHLLKFQASHKRGAWSILSTFDLHVVQSRIYAKLTSNFLRSPELQVHIHQCLGWYDQIKRLTKYCIEVQENLKIELCFQ